MKPKNQAVLDEIMQEVRTYTITQRRALLRAMRNPYFRHVALSLSTADETTSRRAFLFIQALTQKKA